MPFDWKQSIPFKMNSYIYYIYVQSEYCHILRISFPIYYATHAWFIYVVQPAS